MYQSRGPPYTSNGSTHASPALIRAMIETTYEAGGAGALFWVDEEATIPRYGLAELVTSTTGPLAKNFLAKVNACAAEHCSEHGRCVGLDGGTVGKEVCRCAVGWSGLDCSNDNIAGRLGRKTVD